MNYSIRYSYQDFVNNSGNASRVHGTKVITARDPQAADALAYDVMLPSLIRLTSHQRGTLTIDAIVPLG